MGTSQSSFEERLFEVDPFYWLCRCFCDGQLRREHMASVLASARITGNMANEVKSKIRDLLRKKVPNFDDFYPDVIISYSTGYRQNHDEVDGAGPGLMVVVALIAYLFEEGHPCYSDIMTRGGQDWNEYFPRLERAKVMVFLLSRTSLRSAHCLKEVGEADRLRVQVLPVRLHETSVNGIDIANDTEAMWPDEVLESYAGQDRNLLDTLKVWRYNAKRVLSRAASIPDYRTLLSEPGAAEELLKRVEEIKQETAGNTDGDPRERNNLLRGLQNFLTISDVVRTNQNSAEHSRATRDHEEKQPEMNDSDVFDTEDDVEITAVMIRLNRRENENWNDCIISSKDDINELLAKIYKHTKRNTERPDEPPQLQVEERYEEHKSSFFGCYYTKHVVVRLDFDEKVRDNLDSGDYESIRFCCHNIAELLKEAGADDDMLKKIFSKGLYKGSLNIIIEAPDEAFEILYSEWVKRKVGGKGLNIGNDVTPVYIESLAPLFVVKTRPGLMGNERRQAISVGDPGSMLSKDGLPIDSEALDAIDMLLYVKDDSPMTVLIPKSIETWQNLLDGGLQCWRGDEKAEYIDEPPMPEIRVATVKAFSKRNIKKKATSDDAEDMEEENRWAAEQGNANAIFSRGVCYENGNGVEKDLAEAVRLYRQAADQGLANAMFNLGVCYENGNGVEKDLEEAVRLYRKAADQGFANAMFNLGVCHENGNGVEKDLEETVRLYRKAVDQGNANAMFNLGVCYENGNGVEKDLEETVRLYRKAADQGNANAMFNLGVCYENGNGVEKDLEESVRLYRKAADQGNANAMFNFGDPSANDEMTRSGVGFVPVNFVETPKDKSVEATGESDSQGEKVRFLAQERIATPKLLVIKNAALTAITYDQLMEARQLVSNSFADEERETQVTMRDVHERIVVPICQQTGTPYANYKNPNGCKVEAFVSHSWDQPFDEFVESIREVFQSHIKKPNLWIDAFALNLCDSENQLGMQESSSLESTPFVTALREASMFVVVRNSVTDLYHRIWCVCELMYAKSFGFIPNKTFVTGPDSFSDSTTSCLDAKSSNRQDRAKILKELVNEHDIQEIDGLIDQFRKSHTRL